MDIRVSVLGPITVTDAAEPVAIGSRRRRELLGRLVAADGHAVSLDRLVTELWDEPPSSASGTIRTFVSELRRALEPDRPARAASRVIETVGTGYALRIPREHVDAHRFEDTVRAARDRTDTADRLTEALSWWRGEPYGDLEPSGWVWRERSRLTQLRNDAVELRAAAILRRGGGAVLVSELEAFAASHPWRERAWAQLAHALYQADRQVDALDALRDARSRLGERFGLESAERLDRLERDILRHAPHLAPDTDDAESTRLLTRTTATGVYTRLRAMSTVAGSAAVSGGGNLEMAQRQRAAAVAEADLTGDPDLTARVIAAYDVPTIWTRADDPQQSRVLVDTTRRTLERLGDKASPTLRCRLWATIGLEHRGSRDDWAADAADQAERLARRLSDPRLVVLALNARFVQSFQRPGNTALRERLAAELIDVSARHDLTTFEILGHLIQIQVHAARGTNAAAQPHVDAAERLAARHEIPLVNVLTEGFRTMCFARTHDDPAAVAQAYRDLSGELAAAGMPGVETGMFPLALLAIRIRHDRPAPVDPGLDWGPYRPFALPLLELAAGDHAAARAAAARLPSPAADQLYEAMWAVNACTALRLRDRDLAARAREALAPARGEIAGGATAMVTFGAVDDIMADLDTNLGIA